MAGEFSVNTSDKFTTGTTAKTFLQITAAKDLASILPYGSFDGTAPDGPQVLVEVFRGNGPFSDGVTVTPVALDETETNAQSVVEAAVSAKENAQIAKTEPNGANAKRIWWGLRHPQGEWQMPFLVRLKAGQTLAIRYTVSTAVGAQAGFYGRQA